MRLILCGAAALSLAGCGIFQDTVVSTPPARCADLVPSSWVNEPVEAAPIPADQSALLATLIGQPLTQVGAAALVGPWAAAYVAQGGQLAKANGRTVDAVEIVRGCETLVNESRADAD